ncbi:MAG: hypothetical protein WKF92_11280 [Pyrinomonadaceae bacterium]
MQTLFLFGKQLFAKFAGDRRFESVFYCSGRMIIKKGGVKRSEESVFVLNREFQVPETVLIKGNVDDRMAKPQAEQPRFS